MGVSEFIISCDSTRDMSCQALSCTASSSPTTACSDTSRLFSPSLAKWATETSICWPPASRVMARAPGARAVISRAASGANHRRGGKLGLRAPQQQLRRAIGGQGAAIRPQHQQRGADRIQQRLQMILSAGRLFLARLQPGDGPVDGKSCRPRCGRPAGSERR